MKCLICNDPIRHGRMGIDACRPCAAFYKRNAGNFEKFACKVGGDTCREANPKTTCRKCRMDRFREVIARANTDPVAFECMEESVRTTNFIIDHTNIHDIEASSSSATPLLCRAKSGYSLMCTIRKAGEQAYKEDFPEANVIRAKNLELTVASYGSVIPLARVAKAAAIEFCNYTFSGFRALDDAIKNSIVETSFRLINLIEATYRTNNNFPREVEVKMLGYTTYLRNTDLESFFENSQDPIDKANLIKVFKLNFAQWAKLLRQFFEVVELTDTEFVALLGLALWQDEHMNSNNDLLKMASRYRSDIMRELHVYYASQGKVDYAARVGNIFCLLVNCKNYGEQTEENLQVCRLLNLFESEFAKESSK